MKAYVIKNEEGKYLTGFYLKDGESEPAFDTKDLTQALLYNEENYVFYADLDEPVEITIAEGDLEHQLAEKEKEIETLKKKLKSTQIVNDSFLDIVQNHKNFNNVVNEVLLQVKPIKLRTQIANDFFRLIAAKEQQIRHQVCQEIRDRFIYVAHTKKIADNYSIGSHSLNDFLDQIEEGEK